MLRGRILDVAKIRGLPKPGHRALCPLCYTPCGWVSDVLFHLEEVHKRQESQILALCHSFGIEEGSTWPLILWESGGPPPDVDAFRLDTCVI